jgi:amidophosphoribosyltransferase
MCGIAAIYAPGLDVARLVYFGLYALQHRGQESAGIAVGNGQAIVSHREMGLLTGVFNEEILGGMQGDCAIGHTRYSTSGSSVVVNAQPFIEHSSAGSFAFAHNGNLTNADALLAALPGHVELDATSDSEIFAKTIAYGSAPTVASAHDSDAIM